MTTTKPSPVPAAEVQVWNPYTLKFEGVTPGPKFRVRLLTVLTMRHGIALMRGGGLLREAIARRPASCWSGAMGVPAAEEAAVKTHDGYRWEPIDPGR